MRVESSVSGNKVTVTCPFCGQVTTIEMSDSAVIAYQEGKRIDEESFPNLSKFEREALISGMCFDCQEATFHQPAPGHEDRFGKFIRHCGCCDCPIWECDKMGHKYVCVQCGEEYKIEPQNKKAGNNG